MRRIPALLILLAAGLLASPATAQYFKKPMSDLDPSIMRIDDMKHLGAKLEGATPIVDDSGRIHPLSEHLGRPLILVLSYYSCDGSCSVINQALAGLLKDVTRVKPGEDFRILTLSFDRNDDLKTAAAFKRQLAVDAKTQANWTLATFKNEADLKAETAKIGFKFFWSPEDKFFIHPGAFLFFTPDGRLARILYPPNAGAEDIELAVLDAKDGQFKPSEIVNFAMSLCFSYSFADGKYVMSVPIFVGFGALCFGIVTLFSSLAIYKRRKQRPMGGTENAYVA